MFTSNVAQNLKAILVGAVITSGLTGCRKNKEQAEESKTPIEILSSDLSLAEQATFVRKFPLQDEPYIYGGVPKVTKTGDSIKVLRNTGYVTGYSEKLGLARWVAYKLTRHGEPGVNLSAPIHSGLRFKMDQRTTAKVPSTILSKSGYDRGHLAPNDSIGINYGEQAQRETFLMSNIVPQSAGLNRGAWRSLETIECNSWANQLDELWIVTGPITTEQSKRVTKGKKNTTIPESFYKIFIEEDNDRIRMLAIRASQETEGSFKDLEILSVDEVEAVTNLDFNHLIPDLTEDAIEAKKSKTIFPKDW